MLEAAWTPAVVVLLLLGLPLAVTAAVALHLGRSDAGSGSSSDVAWWQRYGRMVASVGHGDGGKLMGGQRPADPALATCQSCGAADPANRCAGCSSVAYCSRACQQKAWKAGHKHECKKLRKARQAAARRASTAGGSSSSEAGEAGVEAGAVDGGKERPEESNSTPPLPKQVLFPPERYRQLAESPPSRRAPLGLHNVGNSCYANSLLQSLLATPALAAYLVSGEHGRGCLKPSPSEWCVLCELEALAQQAYCPGGAAGGALSPRPLLRHVRRLGRQFSFGRQEDSHELYLRLMEAIEAVQLLEAGGKQRFDLRSRETTFIHQAFSGYTRTAVACLSCGHVSRTYECCTSLTLEVSARIPSLEAALARFAATERLDGDNKYKCDRCKQHVAADKYTRVEAAPHYLQICLKRFAPGRFGKITARLSYPERLDLSPYMAPGGTAGGTAGGAPLYRLYAVVVHIDWGRSTDYGHYIAYVRSGDSWHCCDDSTVMPVAASKALSAGAYLLFYEREQPREIVLASETAAAAAAAAGEAAAAEAAAVTEGAGPAAAAAAESGQLPAAAGVAAEAEEAEGRRMLRVETAPASLPHLAADEEAAEDAAAGGPAARSSGELTPAGSLALPEEGQQQQQLGDQQGERLAQQPSVQLTALERMTASASETDLAAARQRSRPASAAATPRAAAGLGAGFGGSGSAGTGAAQQQREEHEAAAAAARAEVEALRREMASQLEVGASPRSTSSSSSDASSRGRLGDNLNPYAQLMDDGRDDGSSSGGDAGSGDDELEQATAAAEAAAASEAAIARVTAEAAAGADAAEAQQHAAAAAAAAAGAAALEEPPCSSRRSSGTGTEHPVDAAAAPTKQAAPPAATCSEPDSSLAAEAGCTPCTPRHRASVTTTSGGERVLRLSVDLPGVQEQAQVEWRLQTGGPATAAQLLLRAERWRLALPLPVKVAAESSSTKWSKEKGKLTVTWPVLS